MIALCHEHHDKADGGAFANEQLHEYKKKGFSSGISAEFNWMRNTIIVKVGGNFHRDPKIILEYNGKMLFGLIVMNKVIFC